MKKEEITMNWNRILREKIPSSIRIINYDDLAYKPYGTKQEKQDYELITSLFVRNPLKKFRQFIDIPLNDITNDILNKLVEGIMKTISQQESSPSIIYVEIWYKESQEYFELYLKIPTCAEHLQRLAL